MKLNQEAIEKNIGWMIVFIVLVVSVGGLVEIVPLYFQKSTTEPVAIARCAAITARWCATPRT